MPKKNVLILSLEDEKAKKIANIVGNASCKKIMDQLANGKATESDLARKLNIPLSTIHYNVSQLVKAGLVVSEEYHYSAKGKEVNHYKLANDYILITPKATRGLKTLMQSILPIGLVAAGTALLLDTFLPSLQQTVVPTQAMRAEAAFADESAKIAVAQLEAAPVAVQAPIPLETVSSLPTNIALWFFFGALFALVLFALMKMFKK